MLKLFKKIMKLFLSRVFVISILLLFQIVALIILVYKIGVSGIYVEIIFTIISIIALISILNRDFNPAYKISWILLVSLVPFVGVVFYLIFGRVGLSKRFRRRINANHNELCNHFLTKDSKIEIEDEQFNKIRKYITNTTAMPIWDNTITKYLSSGEQKLEYLLKELEKAERFIFLEYFIIEPGKMWNQIYDVLLRKVKQGVEVRIIYDDFGCIKRLPYNFKKILKKDGIKVIAFNPIVPRLNMIMNYRDHRKIVIIDGNVAFTGGINIADEYINEDSLYGHWKDAAIMVKGDAVWNFTLMFIEMWRNVTKEQIDYEGYFPTVNYTNTGYVLPFSDGPFSGHLTTEMTYMQIIQHATKYVYITTPYLILDNEIITALKTAALSGIDVRIITPSIPDKKLVFWVTQSYYRELIEAGVKIYQYGPGFIHSKTCVSDDEVGMIGTANLDFRSLYLHFEVSCLLYKTNSIIDLKKDFMDTLELSYQVTYEQCAKNNIFKKIITAILKGFSPML